jgi:hypothetical protein
MRRLYPTEGVSREFRCAKVRTRYRDIAGQFSSGTSVAKPQGDHTPLGGFVRFSEAIRRLVELGLKAK